MALRSLLLLLCPPALGLTVILVGDSALTDCSKLCASQGYECAANIFGSFSCEIAATAYCQFPYMEESMDINPNEVECYGGGGCFVNCAAHSYLELRRWEGHCGINNCDIGEYSFELMCPCRSLTLAPTPSPPYVIEVTEDEKLGLFALILISSCCVVWLLCCSCSNDVVKRSFSSFPSSLPSSHHLYSPPALRSYGEVATEEELESFVKEELNLQTQALWFLWCQPLKSCCWACFQDFKRKIYRSCCLPPVSRSTPQQEVDSTHSNPSSSHPLTSQPSPPAEVLPNHFKDEESQSLEATASAVASQFRSLLTHSSPTEPPVASTPTPPMAPPFISHNYKNVLQSSSSQRLQAPQSTPSSAGVELMRAHPAPHTNDSLRPLKSSMSDLYGSHSSKLYGRHSEAAVDNSDHK